MAKKDEKIVLRFKKNLQKLFVFFIYPAFTKLFYGKVDYRFMNLGMVLDDKMKIKLHEDHQSEYLQAQMYYHLVSELTIEGKDILEIGSGCGGGCFFYKTYFKPNSVTGIDIIKQNILISKERYKELGIDFFCDDACHFQMEKNSRDVVVNLESSHSYSDFSKFVSNVFHVLRSGGYFSFADSRYPKDYNELISDFLDKGFVILKEENITKNVCGSLILDNDRKLGVFKNYYFFRKVFSNFMFLKGSRNYNKMMNGTVQYYHVLLQKPFD